MGRGDHAALRKARCACLDVTRPARAHVELEGVVRTAQHRPLVDRRHEDIHVKRLTSQVARVGRELRTHATPVSRAGSWIGQGPQVLPVRHQIRIEIVLFEWR